MSTSAIVSLFRVEGTKKIARAALAYVKGRGRQAAYNLLVSEFKRSGLSQIDLAKRLDTEPAVVCRWLARPNNLEVNTLSAVIFALTGGFLKFDVVRPSSVTVAIFPDKKIVPTQTQTAKTELDLIAA